MSSEIDKKFILPKRFANSKKSAWVEYDGDNKPLDLSKILPDFAAPESLRKALAETAESDNILLHQYTNGYGHPRLVTALAKLYGGLLSREIKPKTEILVTVGTHEALFTAIDGHIDNGDRVVLIEPCVDVYRAMVENAGGVIDAVQLELKRSVDSSISSSDYVLDPEKLSKAFNDKTKAIILNNPNNPLGKVYTNSELELIADLCKKWDVICISDESHEWQVYKPHQHQRIVTLSGMWERTITVGSADATFNTTGWKAAWVLCPENLILNLQMVHQTCGYVSPTPIQEAVAIGFEKELSRLNMADSHFSSFTSKLEAKRDFLFQVLTEIGVKPILPEGGCFMIVDWTNLEHLADSKGKCTRTKDCRFTYWMAKHVGIQGIPMSAFYGDSNQAPCENCIVFCFVKSESSLEKAAALLKKLKSGTN